jgi:hypothetical protein
MASQLLDGLRGTAIGHHNEGLLYILLAGVIGVIARSRVLASGCARSRAI